MKNNLIKKLQNIFSISTFSKNILKVLSGNVVGQIINIVTIPVIARLFTKEVLGLNALFISFITTLFITGSFKYESAIVLAEDEKEEEDLFFLSSFILIIFSLFLITILILFSDNILRLFNAEELDNIYYILIIGVFLKAFQQIGQQILIRNKKYKKLSFCYISEIGFNKLPAIVIGIFYNTFSVLWSCYLLGTFVSILFFINEIKKYSIKNFNIQKLLKLMKKYKKFPLVNNLSNFLNNFSMQIPVMIISAKFGLEAVAIFGYANKIISLPINLLASSIGKVYFQEAAAIYRNNKKSLKILYFSIEKKLILMGLCVIIFIQLFASILVNMFLGSEWVEVIPILRLMSIYVFFRFLCNPVSSTFTVINRQEIGLIVVIFSIIIRFLSLSLFKMNFQNTLLVYSISVSVFYISYNSILLFFIKRVEK